MDIMLSKCLVYHYAYNTSFNLPTSPYTFTNNRANHHRSENLAMIDLPSKETQNLFSMSVSDLKSIHKDTRRIMLLACHPSKQNIILRVLSNGIFNNIDHTSIFHREANDFLPITKTLLKLE